MSLTTAVGHGFILILVSGLLLYVGNGGRKILTKSTHFNISRYREGHSHDGSISVALELIPENVLDTTATVHLLI
jgi:hypothetical protein